MEVIYSMDGQAWPILKEFNVRVATTPLWLILDPNKPFGVDTDANDFSFIKMIIMSPLKA